MKKTILPFAFLLLVLAAQTTLACSCANWEEADLTVMGKLPFDGKSYIESYEKSGAIFVGQVVKIKRVKFPAKDYNWYNREVTLSVSKSWTGANSNKIVVYTNKSGASCGYDFVKGESYVVFASKEPQSLIAETYGDKLSVGLCSYTTPLNQAENILKGLGEAKVSF